MLSSLFGSKKGKEAISKNPERKGDGGGTSDDKEEDDASTVCGDDGRSSCNSRRPSPDNSIEEYYLKKRLADPHKKGLYWREDPAGKDWLRNNRNWPRDYATIRGTVIVHEGRRWLMAKEVKQANSDKWCKAPKGAYLPFHFGKLYVLVPLKKYTPKPCRTKRLRGILVKEYCSVTASRRRAQRKHDRHVTFSNVFLREYARTVGDNPSCGHGPPITISWEYSDTVSIPLESFQKQRDLGRRRSSFELVITREERERMLRQDWLVPQASLAQAVREVLRIKQSRRRTIEQQTTTIGKVGDALLAKLARKGNNHKAMLLLQKHHQASAQYHEEQERHQEKDEQESKPRIASSRSLLKRKASLETETELSDLEDDPIVPNQLIHLENLTSKIEACRLPPGSELRSAFKQQSKQQTQNTKSVTFAANYTTKQVWCFVEQVDRFDKDPEIKPLLWWQHHDLDVRQEQDQGIIKLMTLQYGALLRKAYKSTRTIPPSDNEFGDQDAAKQVELDWHEMTLCSIARGLEPKVIAQTRDFMVQTHAKAVLGHRSDEDVMLHTSLQISRPAKLLALKIAAFDQYHAAEDSQVRQSAREQ